MARSWLYILLAVLWPTLALATPSPAAAGAETGRLRYRVHGSQYIDERVATYNDGTQQSTYYQLKDNFPVAGTGSATGTSLACLGYTALGDYTYDKMGNRMTSVVIEGDTRLDPNTSYTYDNLDRVTEASYGPDHAEAFGYDLLGNRTSYTDRLAKPNTYGTANTVNQYTSINGVPLATSDPATSKYDAAGNLIETEAGYRFEYDYENRLVTVRDKDANHTVLASYTYDALGRRVTQTKGGVTTSYVYDGETVVAEYVAGGGLLRYHIHGPSYVDEHVLLKDVSAGKEYYYLLGTLYSVTGLVDAEGAVVERYRCDAYGKPTIFGLAQQAAPGTRDFIRFQMAYSGTQACNPAFQGFDLNGDGKVDVIDYALFFQGGRPGPSLSPYLFTGQPLDFFLTDASGRPLVLYHYRARAYDAYHGRFLQRDPALYSDGMNLYAYAKLNPLRYTDPSGEFSLAESVVTNAIKTVLYSTLQGALSGGVSSAVQGEDILRGTFVGAMGGLGSGLAYVSGAGIIAEGAFSSAMESIGNSLYEDPLLQEEGAIKRLVTDALGSAISGGATAGAVHKLSTIVTNVGSTVAFAKHSGAAPGYSHLSPDEVATKLRIEAQEGIQLIESPSQRGADTLWKLGSSAPAHVDFMGTARGWQHQRMDQFLTSFEDHTRDHDVTVVDLTGATQEQIYQVLDKYYSLSPRDRGGVVFTGW